MNRRVLTAGLVSFIAAPAIIRTPGLLMPVRALELSTLGDLGPDEMDLSEAALEQIMVDDYCGVRDDEWRRNSQLLADALEQLHNDPSFMEEIRYKTAIEFYNCFRDHKSK